MRKMIAMMLVLVMGLSLYAADNASDKYGKDGAPEVRALPDYRAPSGRTEEYELYLQDSWGDGWNGAAVDLLVNGTEVITGATITDGDTASYNFDVDDFDYITTSWTSGSYDSECSYGIYDAEGNLVIESDAGEISLSIDFSCLLYTSDAADE